VSRKDGSTGDQSQTVERALQVLQVLSHEPEGLTVAELAERQGTHRAGIYRLVRPLAASKLVERSADGRYVLGVGLLTLASGVRGRLLDIAAVELRQLAETLSATTGLTLRDGDEGVVAVVEEPRNATYHLAYRPGLRHPIDMAASGVALLAGGEPLLGERHEVTIARECGYALTRNEMFVGTMGIGVPISVAGQPTTAAVSVVWLGERDVEPVASALMRSARAIEQQLR